MQRISRLIMALCLFAMTVQAQKFVGGDISLLPTYEAHGVRYLDQSGSQVQPLDFWHDKAGWNATRVRIFVDPSRASVTHQDEGVRQSLGYVTTLCKRIKAKGYALMLDFHYADTWTDPGQHTTPSAWASSDPEVLADSVYRYTVKCLSHLKANGIVPDFIQPGNEITFGMMWPTGRCYPDGSSVVTDATNITGSSGMGTGTFANLVKYLKAGVRGSKEVCPDAKIVIHTELGSSWNATKFYETLGNRVDYDIIGLSYYPDYHGTLGTLSSVLTTLERRHGSKEIMIVETGYGGRWSLNGNHSSAVQAFWPLTEAGQKQFASDLIAELHKHEKVTGLFWWMPEDNEFWANANPARSHWWNASLYTQDTGKPLAAMFELQRFLSTPATGIDRISFNKLPDTSPSPITSPVYTLQGMQVHASAHIPRGIYIKGGRKTLVCR